MESKYGVWSTWTNAWCFGIVACSEQNAFNALLRHIGKDAYKWRFEIRPMPIADARRIERDHQEYLLRRAQKGAQSHD